MTAYLFLFLRVVVSSPSFKMLIIVGPALEKRCTARTNKIMQRIKYGYEINFQRLVGQESWTPFTVWGEFQPPP